jgi:cytochrome c5
MSGSHHKLPNLFWVQLALAAFIGFMYLTADPIAKHGEADEHSTKTVETAAANLAPVGAVSTASADTGGASAGRSGEEVYNGVCGTCHNTGIANAPKLDDKAAWEARVANGLDGLMETASKGKGAMPPNGGDPKLTSDELKATILYMTKKVGFDL